VDRDHRAKAACLRTLTAVGKPVVAVAFGTDVAHLQIGGRYTSPIQEQCVGSRQGKPMMLIVRRERFISIGSSCLTPRVDDVFAHVIAAATNGWAENDVDVVDPCPEGGGHGPKRRTNDICDSSPPPGVGDADGRTTVPASWVDDQHWLAVGMQGHQHRADLVCHQCIAETNLSRSRFGAVSGVRFRGNPYVPPVDLT